MHDLINIYSESQCQSLFSIKLFCLNVSDLNRYVVKKCTKKTVIIINKGIRSACISAITGIQWSSLGAEQCYQYRMKVLLLDRSAGTVETDRRID